MSGNWGYLIKRPSGWQGVNTCYTCIETEHWDNQNIVVDHDFCTLK